MPVVLLAGVKVTRSHPSNHLEMPSVAYDSPDPRSLRFRANLLLGGNLSVSGETNVQAIVRTKVPPIQIVNLERVGSTESPLPTALHSFYELAPSTKI